MSASATSGRPSVHLREVAARTSRAPRGVPSLVAGEEIAQVLRGGEAHLVVGQAERQHRDARGVEREPRRQVLAAIDEPQDRVEARLAVGARDVGTLRHDRMRGQRNASRRRRRSDARWRRDDRAARVSRDAKSTTSAQRASRCAGNLAHDRRSGSRGSSASTPSASFRSKSLRRQLDRVGLVRIRAQALDRDRTPAGTGNRAAPDAPTGSAEAARASSRCRAASESCRGCCPQTTNCERIGSSRVEVA